MAYNRGDIFKKIASKEKEIDLGIENNISFDKLILLRDKLERLNKKAQLETMTPLEEAPDNNPLSSPPEETGVDDNFNNNLKENHDDMHKEAEDIAEALNMILAEELSNIFENDKSVFEIDYTNLKDYLILDPSNDAYVDYDDELDIVSFIDKSWEYLDSLNIQNRDSAEKIQDRILPLIKEYYESIERETIEEKDQHSPGHKKKVKVLNFKNSKPIIDKIFNVLSEFNIVGYATDEQLDDKNNFTGVKTMASKRFNLKKHADKLYDTLREREIMHKDLQYLTRHPKTIKQYEEVYIGDYIWQHSVMDKYYPEKQDPETGEYFGGYINDRFHVHVNTEGNSMRARPDGKVPDRPESYSTERRLEELRYDKSREYEPSEGEKTEQQNKIVASSEYKFSKDAGLHKATFAGKVMYFDTDEELNIFKRIANIEDSEESKKKKISQINQSVETAPIAEPEGTTENIEINPYLAKIDIAQVQTPEELKGLIQSMNLALSTSEYRLTDLERYQQEIFNKFYDIHPEYNVGVNKINTDSGAASGTTQDDITNTWERLGDF